MIETQEQIDTILTELGIDLTFEDSVIKGIPGFEFSMLYREASTIYEVKRQEFSFQIAAYASDALELKIGDTFTITDSSTNIYSFELIQNPLPDLTGWVQLDVDYKGRELP